MNDTAKLHQRPGARRFGSLAAIAMGATIAAMSANACNAQCVEPSARVPPLVLQTFTSNPGWLLREARNKKEKLERTLTQFLVTDISVLPAVRVLVSVAPSADRVAIGAALHRAEARCRGSKPEAAQTLNDFVRKLEDYAVLSGYSAEVEATREPAKPLPSGLTVRPSLGLMSGEWGTELKDPFASVPLPR